MYRRKSFETFFIVPDCHAFGAGWRLSVKAPRYVQLCIKIGRLRMRLTTQFVDVRMV